MQVLYNYFRYNGKIFRGCAIFVARCYIIRAFMRNQDGMKTELQRKVKRRICVRDITTSTTCTTSFLCHFFLLSSSTLLPKWYTYWMTPIKIHNISMSGSLSDMENLLQFNTSWLVSVRTWSYFRLFFSFSYSSYDLEEPILNMKSHTLNWYWFLLKFLLKTKTYNLAVGNCGSSIYC